MADEPVPWSNIAGVPGWMEDLKTLGKLSSGAITTLATIASDPETWVRTVISEWIVGGILDFVQYVLGWAIFAFERTASILNIGGILTGPIDLLGTIYVGTIERLYEMVYGVAASAGLAAPLAAAFAVTVVLTVLAVVVFAAAKVIPGSDLVEGGLEALR